jgi:crossover junction endodeoxyribonuclease RuvC
VVILGIDPGSRVLGYGLIDWSAAPRFLEAGAIEATKKDAPGARVAEIGQCLQELLREMAARYQIALVGIEAGFMGGRSVRTDLMLANARGVALYMVARELRIEPVFVAPSSVKKAVTGNGRAEKPEVQTAVKRILMMRTRPGADAADALAVAIASAGREPH